MAILVFLTQLAGATMLLLFAVRMVRTGIERSYGASFQRIMTRNNTMLGSGATGMMLAVVLQSSAAVALLTAGFAAGGYLAFPAGLAIVLGGDLGSALVIQILSFRLDWLVPLLLATGGWLFVKTERKKTRQIGRILMGIAFILISLRFLREAMDPIRDSAFLPAIADYLVRDYVTAFLVGAALAFVMHSSVAAILMCVTLVQIGALPFSAGVSLLLGANLGSALIPVWLTRGMDIRARRIPFANLALRGAWAILCLFAVNLALRSGLIDANHQAQMLVNAHLAFNASLLVLSLPFCGLLGSLFERLLPDQPESSDSETLALPASALDPKMAETPALAQSALKRELLRMADLVEMMFRPLPDLYRAGDAERIKAVRAMDQEVNACLSNIRNFVASLSDQKIDAHSSDVARNALEYAVRLETAGDVVAKRLTALAQDMSKSGKRFSREGWQELEDMHEKIMANLKLATNVIISEDLESARLLNLEKTEIKRAERDSRKRHFRRLQSGKVESLESSDTHLETLQALREFNSHIAAISTPILYEQGQLLETRLIEDMPPRTQGSEV